MVNLNEVKVLYSEEMIQQRIREIGEQITKDYEGKELVLVGLLKGAAYFMVDLSKQIRLPVTLEFMTVSSYQNTESTGKVKIVQDLDSPISGKNVLIVEDIIDTGRTLHEIKQLFEIRGAKSVSICALLDKKAMRLVDVPVDYVGFDVEDRFMLGYGLDYNQYYRNLPYIGYVDSIK